MSSRFVLAALSDSALRQPPSHRPPRRGRPRLRRILRAIGRLPARPRPGLRMPRGGGDRTGAPRRA